MRLLFTLRRASRPIAFDDARARPSPLSRQGPSRATFLVDTFVDFIGFNVQRILGLVGHRRFAFVVKRKRPFRDVDGHCARMRAPEAADRPGAYDYAASALAAAPLPEAPPGSCALLPAGKNELRATHMSSIRLIASGRSDSRTSFKGQTTLSTA